VRKYLCLLITIFYILTATNYANGIGRQVFANEVINPLPIRSGPVTALPWDKDPEFLKAKAANDTPVLLGAYKTVLLDPLPGEEYNVHLGARILCGTVVKSGSVFSQNKTVGPYSASKGFKKGPVYLGSKVGTVTGGGVCKIATTLYNVAVLSNFPIVERHYHGMPVSYTPYGQDATVTYRGKLDFKFKNTKPYPILIWSQGIGDTLYIGFYGRDASPTVKWQHRVLSVQKTTTIYRKNSKLHAGKKKVIVIGMDGKTVESWVKIYYPDGKVQTKKMGISRYRPLPNVIEVGGK
jgi:vancomycin resistance protein YoaR